MMQAFVTKLTYRSAVARASETARIVINLPLAARDSLGASPGAGYNPRPMEAERINLIASTLAGLQTQSAELRRYL